MALISALMKTEMVTAAPKETVRDVAKRMRDNAVGAVLVLDAGKLIGLFSERDLVNRVVAHGLDPAKTRVDEVATRELVTVDVNTPIRQCAELIKGKQFRHLPVLDRGRAVGILSTRDFFEYVVDGLERLIDQLRYRKALEEGQDPYDHLGGSYGE